MDVIAVAKELGMGLVAHEDSQRFKNAEIAMQADGELQALILGFNDYAERMQGAKDAEAEAANAHIAALYEEIMANENMAEFAGAKTAFETLLNNVYATINHFVNPDGGGGCAGSCAGCAGCSPE